MISILTHIHIRRRSKDLGRKIPKNWKNILKKYKEAANKKYAKIYICFSWLKDTGMKVLDANGTIYHTVMFNSEWAARIVLYNNEETLNAFLVTFGHEVTHKEHEILPLQLEKSERQFVSRVNEVRADFGGAFKMANKSRTALLRAIDYKRSLKKVDREDFAHPSWEKRRYYAANFDFDEKLIRQIARDIHCTNEKLIKKVIDRYDVMKLKD